MKRLVLIPIAALAACSTTGEKLGAMPVRWASQTAQTPQAVAACIINRTPGLYAPVTTQEGDATVVAWRLDPLGSVTSFTVQPDGVGSKVEVRSLTSQRKQIAKVEGCYKPS